MSRVVKEREVDVERYLGRQVKSILKGKAYKFTSPGMRSVPDRLICWPMSVFFVECKASGAMLTPKQELMRAELEALGQTVYKADSKHSVLDVLEAEVERTCRGQQALDLLDKIEATRRRLRV